MADRRKVVVRQSCFNNGMGNSMVDHDYPEATGWRIEEGMLIVHRVLTESVTESLGSYRNWDSVRWKELS